MENLFKSDHIFTSVGGTRGQKIVREDVVVLVVVVVTFSFFLEKYRHTFNFFDINI